MLGYDYEIIYKKGSENIVADALSRQIEEESTLLAISLPIPAWIEEARKEWFSHPWLSQLINQLQADPNSTAGYSWQDEILRYKDRVVISPTSTLKSCILVELHSSPTARHSVNKCLETYLRCFTSEKQHLRVQWLPLAEWWYNTNYHATTKMTPYEAVYGQLPPSPISYIKGCSKVQAADQLLQNRTTMLAHLRENLHQAQNRMKQQVDQHRSERQFQEGD
eukprot:PITA_19607